MQEELSNIENLSIAKRSNLSKKDSWISYILTSKDNSNTQSSHNEENIEFYEEMDELSNRNKDYAEDSEFAYAQYNDKRYEFIYIFGKYIQPYMKEIDHPSLIQ